MIHLLKLKEFLLAQVEEEWRAILFEIEDDSSALVNFVRKASVFSLKNELKVKKVSTARAEIRAVGLDDLIRRIEKKHGNSVFDIQEVKTSAWIGFCVSSGTEEIMGCAFVNNVKSGKKTPPNWDGTIEELNKFNSC
jgi:hypothetical protein